MNLKTFSVSLFCSTKQWKGAMRLMIRIEIKKQKNRNIIKSAEEQKICNIDKEYYIFGSALDLRTSRTSFFGNNIVK